MTMAAHTHGDALRIREAHVVTGDGRDIENADILIREGRIQRVEQGRLETAEAKVIDGTGKTVVPALGDLAATQRRGDRCHRPRRSTAHRLRTHQKKATAGRDGDTVDVELVMPQWGRFWGAMTHFDARRGHPIRQQIRGNKSQTVERQEPSS